MFIQLTVGNRDFAVPNDKFILLAYNREHPCGTRDNLKGFLSKEVPRAYSIEWHGHNLTAAEIEALKDEDSVRFEYLGQWHLMKGRLMSADDPLVWQGII